MSTTNNCRAMTKDFCDRYIFEDKAKSATIERLKKFLENKSQNQSQPNNLLKVQTLRILELVEHLKQNDVAILADPVGSGKTVVSLSAVRQLFERKTIEQVVIVVPNIPVAKKWANEAQCLFYILDNNNTDVCSLSPPNNKTDKIDDIQEAIGFGWPNVKQFNGKLSIVTRHNLPGKVKNSLIKTLFIVDEAHRGFQNVGGEYYKKLKNICGGCKVLLVTATPMQLSAQGLTNMLTVASAEATIQWESIKELGEKVKIAFSAARNDYKNGISPLSENTKIKGVEAGKALKEANDAFKKCFLLPTYPRADAGIPDPPVAKATEIQLGDWAIPYHVARIVPELIQSHSGDMFHRRLVSSSDAFWNGATGRLFTQNKGKDNSSVSRFYETIKKHIEVSHPKIKAVVDWITSENNKNRHILVFCVFNETQRALKNALEIKLNNENEVHDPDNPTDLNKKNCLNIFQKEVDIKKDGRRVLIVRDNLSESIDLDGGNPCIVHYDLAWNPVRLTQRYGRVVRASSGFKPLAEEDIYIPCLAVEVDKRMADTLNGRSQMAGILLPTEIGSVADEDSPKVSDSNQEEENHADHAWAVPTELLQLIHCESVADDGND